MRWSCAPAPGWSRTGYALRRPWAEGFHDRSSTPAGRAAIGLTKYNKLLLVTIDRPVYYTHVSKVMKALGP